MHHAPTPLLACILLCASCAATTTTPTPKTSTHTPAPKPIPEPPTKPTHANHKRPFDLNDLELDDFDCDGIPDTNDQCVKKSGLHPHGCPPNLLAIPSSSSLEIREPILFHPRTTRIKTIREDLIKDFKNILQRPTFADIIVELRGTTSKRDGTSPKQLSTLALKRAQTIRTLLIQEGINPLRLLASSHKTPQKLQHNTTTHIHFHTYFDGREHKNHHDIRTCPTHLNPHHYNTWTKERRNSIISASDPDLTTPQNSKLLNEVTWLLKHWPHIQKLAIEHHSCTQNLTKLPQNIYQSLINRGIQPTRLTIKHLACTQPLLPQSSNIQYTPESIQILDTFNTRIQFRIPKP